MGQRLLLLAYLQVVDLVLLLLVLFLQLCILLRLLNEFIFECDCMLCRLIYIFGHFFVLQLQLLLHLLGVLEL